MTDPLSPGARADASMSLVLAAAGAERRNRPRTLVMLSLVLLVAAGAFALASYKALSKARGAIAYQREQTRTINALAGEIAAMIEQESSLIFEPDPTVASKLEGLASVAGIDGVFIDQRDSGPVPGTVGVKKRLYNPRSALRSIEVGPLVKWLAQACDPTVVAGLTPTSIRIRAVRTGPTDKPAGPGEADWELDVKFARMERE